MSLIFCSHYMKFIVYFRCGAWIVLLRLRCVTDPWWLACSQSRRNPFVWSGGVDSFNIDITNACSVKNQCSTINNSTSWRGSGTGEHTSSVMC